MPNWVQNLKKITADFRKTFKEYAPFSQAIAEKCSIKPVGPIKCKIIAG